MNHNVTIKNAKEFYKRLQELSEARFGEVKRLVDKIDRDGSKGLAAVLKQIKKISESSESSKKAASIPPSLLNAICFWLNCDRDYLLDDSKYCKFEASGGLKSYTAQHTEKEIAYFADDPHNYEFLRYLSDCVFKLDAACSRNIINLLVAMVDIICQCNQTILGMTGVDCDARNSQIDWSKSYYRLKKGYRDEIISEMKKKGISWGNLGAGFGKTAKQMNDFVRNRKKMSASDVGMICLELNCNPAIFCDKRVIYEKGNYKEIGLEEKPVEIPVEFHKPSLERITDYIKKDPELSSAIIYMRKNISQENNERIQDLIKAEVRNNLKKHSRDNIVRKIYNAGPELITYDDRFLLQTICNRLLYDEDMNDQLEKIGIPYRSKNEEDNENVKKYNEIFENAFSKVLKEMEDGRSGMIIKLTMEDDKKKEIESALANIFYELKVWDNVKAVQKRYEELLKFPVFEKTVKDIMFRKKGLCDRNKWEEYWQDFYSKFEELAEEERNNFCGAAKRFSQAYDHCCAMFGCDDEKMKCASELVKLFWEEYQYRRQKTEQK